MDIPSPGADAQQSNMFGGNGALFGAVGEPPGNAAM